MSDEQLDLALEEGDLFIFGQADVDADALHPLKVGDDAWSLLWSDVGSRGTRFKVDGAAWVRVVEIADDGKLVCEVIHASGGLVGSKVTRTRAQLYANCNNRSPAASREHAAFREVVWRWWSR